MENYLITLYYEIYKRKKELTFDEAKDKGFEIA